MGEFDASTRRTAFETAKVAEGSDVRTDRRQGEVAKLYIRSFKFLNKIIFNMWKAPRFIKVSPDKWPKFTGEDVKAEYTYNCEFGVKQRQDISARRAEAFNAYLQLREDPLVDPIRLRKYVSVVFQDPEFEQIFNDEVQSANLSLPLPSLQVERNPLPFDGGQEQGSVSNVQQNRGAAS